MPHVIGDATPSGYIEPTIPDRGSTLSGAELDAFINATSDAILVLDREGRCIGIGPCAADPRASWLHVLIGQRLDEVLATEVAHGCQMAIADAFATGAPQRVAYTVTLDGQPHPVVATLAPTRDGTIVWIARHLTPRFEASAALARRERELADVFEAAFDGMLVCAPDLRCLSVNEALCTMLGRSRAELLASDYGALVDPADLQERPLRISELRELRRLVTERRLLRANGRTLVAEVGTTLLEDGRVLLVIHDITERKAAEAAVESLALQDELTGLYNRRGFQRAAEREWARAVRENFDVLVFALDLDDLKTINDSSGHAAGDVALQAVAEALRATFRHADVLARMGGDEFTAFIVPAPLSNSPGADADSRLRTTAEIIRGRFEQHLATAMHGTVGEHGRSLSVSMGLAATSPALDADMDLATVLARADAALYDDKRARKQRGG